MNPESSLLFAIITSIKNTILDILPIILVIAFFQAVVLRKKLHHIKKTIMGMIMVVIGLGVFLVGLEECIFPLGTEMAYALTNPEFLMSANGITSLVYAVDGSLEPRLYMWAYIFGFMIGFATTLAEPGLIAVARKTQEISVGAISEWGLRIAAAFGVAMGVALGTYRIVTGTPLYIYICAGYAILIVQTHYAPKLIIPLAYDAGGITTSTVTVPLIAALGIGLASGIPGRSPLMDGFGIIALASLFPIIMVLGYAMIGEIIARQKQPIQTPL